MEFIIFTQYAYKNGPAARDLVQQSGVGPSNLNFGAISSNNPDPSARPGNQGVRSFTEVKGGSHQSATSQLHTDMFLRPRCETKQECLSRQPALK